MRASRAYNGIVISGSQEPNTETASFAPSSVAASTRRLVVARSCGPQLILMTGPLPGLRGATFAAFGMTTRMRTAGEALPDRSVAKSA